MDKKKSRSSGPNSEADAALDILEGALKRPLFPTLDPNEVKAYEIRTEARERLAALADIERTLTEARQLHAEMAQRLMQRRKAIANSPHQWQESTADLFWAFEQSFSRRPVMRR